MVDQTMSKDNKVDELSAIHEYFEKLTKLMNFIHQIESNSNHRRSQLLEQQKCVNSIYVKFQSLPSVLKRSDEVHELRQSFNKIVVMLTSYINIENNAREPLTNLTASMIDNLMQNTSLIDEYTGDDNFRICLNDILEPTVQSNLKEIDKKLNIIISDLR